MYQESFIVYGAETESLKKEIRAVTSFYLEPLRWFEIIPKVWFIQYVWSNHATNIHIAEEGNRHKVVITSSGEFFPDLELDARRFLKAILKKAPSNDWIVEEYNEKLLNTPLKTLHKFHTKFFKND